MNAFKEIFGQNVLLESIDSSDLDTATCPKLWEAANRTLKEFDEPPRQVCQGVNQDGNDCKVVITFDVIRQRYIIEGEGCILKE